MNRYIRPSTGSCRISVSWCYFCSIIVQKKVEFNIGWLGMFHCFLLYSTTFNSFKTEEQRWALSTSKVAPLPLLALKSSVATATSHQK